MRKNPFPLCCRVGFKDSWSIQELINKHHYSGTVPHMLKNPFHFTMKIASAIKDLHLLAFLHCRYIKER